MQVKKEKRKNENGYAERMKGVEKSMSEMTSLQRDYTDLGGKGEGRQQINGIRPRGGRDYSHES